MSTAISGHPEPDYHDPERYRIRCPDCGSVRWMDRTPERGDRRCSNCDRLMGVTPTSQVDADEDETDAPEIGADDDVDAPYYCGDCDETFDDRHAYSGHFAREHDDVDRGEGVATDGGQWEVTAPVDLSQYVPLDMANNITDERVRQRIAWVDGLGRAYADALDEAGEGAVDRGEGVATDGGHRYGTCVGCGRTRRLDANQRCSDCEQMTREAEGLADAALGGEQS